MKEVAYGNGTRYGYTCNAYGQTTEVSVDGAVRWRWTYGSSGTPLGKEDALLGLGYGYCYDSTGRLVRSRVYDSTEPTSADRTLYAAWYEYDAWGNLVSLTDGNGNAVTDAGHIGNLGTGSITGMRRQGFIMYPAVITILRLGGGWSCDWWSYWADWWCGSRKTSGWKCDS